MIQDTEIIQTYLERKSDQKVHISEMRQLGGDATDSEALKQFGYGHPLLITYQIDHQEKQVVFHSISQNEFGRERQDDRVAAVWLDFKTFNQLPRHVRALDMILHTKEGEMRSIDSADEVLLITKYQPGHPYAQDLERIRDQRKARPLDFQRVDALANYLVEIHKQKHDEPALWRRRLRDLIGHGEGIMGLTDSYPSDLSFVDQAELRQIEAEANRWRWKLKPMDHRLSQVHGDFHPFNVLFDRNLDFYLLDRSRGAWGEPADDLSCMTINYLFFSLQISEQFSGVFKQLHDRFWHTYLSHRPDNELTAVIQPWFAWRALVVASPVWYPTISDEVRRKMLNFARRVLVTERYDYANVDQYLEV